MTFSEIREHMDEYTVEQLMHKINCSISNELEWDLDFFREIIDKIDTDTLYQMLQDKWLRATNICYFSGIQLWNDRINQIRELL